MAERTITTGRSDHLDAASSLLGRVFDKDPVLRYMLCNLSQEEYLLELRPYWYGLCRVALLNGGVIAEVQGWKATSVVLPPGKSMDNPLTLVPGMFGLRKTLWRIGFAGIMRMLGEFSGAVNAAKKKGLNGRRYYYVFALGTEYEFQGKGLGKSLMEFTKSVARGKGVPVWLEATTQHSRAMYLSLGFEEVEEINIGKGKVAADGTMAPGGPGVKLWAMVWRPKPLE